MIAENPVHPARPDGVAGSGVVRTHADPPRPPEGGRGLAVPLLYGSLALAHAGGDARDQAIGALYVLLALHHILLED